MNGANFEIPENKKMMRWKCARELYSYIEHKKYNRTIKMWLFIGVASAISPFNCRLYARSDFMLSRLFHLLRSGRSLLTHSHHFFLLLRSSIFILGLFGWISVCAFKIQAICNVGDDFDNRRASDVNCTKHTTAFMHLRPF